VTELLNVIQFFILTFFNCYKSTFLNLSALHSLTFQRKSYQNMLDLVGVQEVRWDRDGTKPAGEYTFLYGEGNAS
jgi:hypothetical protein